MERRISDIDNNKDDYFEKLYSDLKRGAYRSIGAGSGRKVFDLENGYVAKVARNSRGIAQNEAEYNISLTDDSGLFAKIKAVSKGFRLLIMEKADRIRDITFVWKYFEVRSNQQLYHLKVIKDATSKHSLLIGDLGRSVNWGQINGKPIVIDYGFTQNVRRNYYLPPVFRIMRR